MVILPKERYRQSKFHKRISALRPHLKNIKGCTLTAVLLLVQVYSTFLLMHTYSITATDRALLKTKAPEKPEDHSIPEFAVKAVKKIRG